jgi:hypothetical protein
MESNLISSVPDLRAKGKGIDAQVAQLLRIVSAPIADPAAVALLRLAMAPDLGPAFEWHCSMWPVVRIAREWRRFGAEIEAMFADSAPPERRAA